MRSYATIGINWIHASDVIGTVCAQIALPMACAANVAPKARASAFDEKNNTATTGIHQYRLNNQPSRATGSAKKTIMHAIGTHTSGDFHVRFQSPDSDENRPK